MGGTPSRTRKLTVENDDPTSVIKVSDDVVERLRRSQIQPQQQAPTLPISQPSPSIVGAPFFLHEPSLTTLQLRQANIQELKKNDEYWEKRIKSLENNHRKMNDIMDQEYKRAVEEMDGGKQNFTNVKLPPCMNNKEAVLQCLKENSKEPMKCAQVVQAFEACVNEKRSQVIANRG